MEVFFSIIIPSYNRAAFLPRTIESVRQQDYQNWECIVVDDGSTDNTREVVEGFSDKRINYLYKNNEERSAARNLGIDHAKGEYLCFLDSDDEFYSHHLSSLYTKIEQEGFPVAIFNSGMFEKRGRALLKRPMYDDIEYNHPIDFVWEKFMLPTSVCIHREILSLHQFPEKFNVWEDTHLWLRVVSQFPFYQISEYTTQWNFHSGSSVSVAFDRIDPGHVRNYINCISDLFENYGEILKPFLNENDKLDYQFKKWKMLLEYAYNRKQYRAFLKLIPLGLRKLEKARTIKYLILFSIKKGKMIVHPYLKR